MKFLIALVDFVFIAAYFLLADYLGPKLVLVGKTWLWWLILFALVSGSYLFTRWIPPSRRTHESRNGVLVAVAYTLLLITLYLYDFSVRPMLDRYGIGSAWIICLLLTFVAVAIGMWKSRRGRTGPSERSL